MYEERVDALSAKDQKANVVCLLGKKHGKKAGKEQQGETKLLSRPAKDAGCLIHPLIILI
jgi:hypothetical protein